MTCNVQDKTGIAATLRSKDGRVVLWCSSMTDQTVAAVIAVSDDPAVVVI